MNRIKLLGSRTAVDGCRIQWDLTGQYDLSGGQIILRWNAAGVLQSQTGGEIGVPCLMREIRKFLREHGGRQLTMAMEVDG